MFYLVKTVLPWVYSIVPPFGGAIILLPLALMLIIDAIPKDGLAYSSEE